MLQGRLLTGASIGVVIVEGVYASIVDEASSAFGMMGMMYNKGCKLIHVSFRDGEYKEAS
ncbi:hypothetical protein HanPI659440_Chr17g0666231 [Helianthus annuus]|nr:hypothetical protein HanPI659440_Chr17g0666231 [Helianthus annuus]